MLSLHRGAQASPVARHILLSASLLIADANSGKSDGAFKKFVAPTSALRHHDFTDRLCAQIDNKTVDRSVTKVT